MTNPNLDWINEIKQDPIAHIIAFHKDFTEKLLLSQCQCFLSYSPDLTKEQILSYKSRIVRELDLDNIKISSYDSIYIDQHALNRWNERVGPPTSKLNLECILHCLILLDRIQFTHGWGIIDHDIIFGYSLKNETIIFHTFLGRISLKPGLLNYTDLLRYNEKVNDQLDLFISPNLIRQQLAPIIPKETYILKGTQNIYFIEEYAYSNNQRHLFISKSGDKKRIEIDLNNPFIPLLSKSVLRFLLMKEEKEFVVAHLAYHKPDKLKRLVEKRKEKMRKRGEPILKKQR